MKSSQMPLWVRAVAIDVLTHTLRGCVLHEPDMQISPIRLSDKTSRLRPRLVVAKPGQAYEPEVWNR
jgi:hypothetical protein